VKSKCQRNITGFAITVSNESDEAEVLNKARKKAKRLADIISFRREKRVTTFRTGLRKKIESNPDKWTTRKELTGLYSSL